MNLREKAKTIKQELPVIYLCLKDKRTPGFSKIMAFLVIAYALSPIDLIPDFIPVLGYLDDLIILPLLIVLSIKTIPQEIIFENRERADEIWKDGKPKKWYYAIPIVFVWLLLLYLIIKNAL